MTLTEAAPATAPSAAAEIKARIELPDGDWALLETRPTYGQVNRAYKAWTAAGADKALYLDLMAETILALTLEWRVTGRDGHELPLSREGVDAAPWDKLEPIFERAAAIYGTTQVGRGGSGPNP